MSFDTIYDRKNTGSLKYDCAARYGKPEGLVPLWVADMDFPAPQCVNKALAERCEHGIYGYTEPDERYFNALKNWFSTRHGWTVENNWLLKTPGVVFALCTAIRAYTEPGDAVLIQPPVYYPFSESILENDRRLVKNSLVYRDGEYSIDFADFEEKIQQEKVKLFLLCNPHNPVGRVWSEQELVQLGEICLRHGVTVVSDEIHADFAFSGNRHLVFASLRPEFAEITITCTAPTKTFNLAGLQISNIFVQNAELRRGFRAEMNRAGYSQANVMGLIACRAAYEGGAEWLDKLKEYLVGNQNFVKEFLQEHIPDIHLVEPQGTYLLWLDCSGLGLDDDTLNKLILEKAGLWLDNGSMFGEEGEGFQRINIACPRSVLQKALEQLEKAIKEVL
ncbi:MAG: MalY/PatB family protein [Clostridium sp.]|uniref:MalY/PatB family protein n=1 Tax=Clostridium sp. TaxID=1506 RepID=UPI0029063C7D|nr:MalY/PatB family protein [Clostridium sp.]MDU7338137.1 MalY/PatB family protein [Clostridium sp.]